MTEMMCRYFGERDEVFVSYLYNDIAADERAAFEVHLATCPSCRHELAALGDVRARLAEWSPPELVSSIHPAPAGRGASRWWDVPVWAQVAAAMLFLGVSAAIANLDVRYGPSGLSVRTGWLKPAPPAQDQALVNAAPWRADLSVLGQQLRNEMRAVATSAPTASTGTSVRSTPAADANLMRRFRTLVDESEKRQHRELALRMADVLRDVESERRADLVKIDRSLGLLQNNTGVEVMRQRQMLDYLVRVSQNK